MNLFSNKSGKNNEAISSFIGKHTQNSDAGLDLLMERVGNSRIILLGEASHGTHEYYIWRARITKRLKYDYKKI